MKQFCSSLSCYVRRASREVRIGSTVIGGSRPVAVQSMANCSTLDIQACVAQIEAVQRAGGHIMRFTAPAIRDGEALSQIAVQARLSAEDVALVADIHFTPTVAMVAAQYVDKVRINPGNFPNSKGEFAQLMGLCAQRGVAIRIGVNHGSLSAHIVERYGDTPRGMVASAMEFLEQCRAANFSNVVVSMKSSNVRVMVHAYRLLCAEMAAEGMDYPLHLGVTEAGDGDDARVKSAVGIGALLGDGIGDTIRVSLTEPPQNEIPVAQALADYFAQRATSIAAPQVVRPELYSPYEYRRRESIAVGRIGGANTPLLHSELNAAELIAIHNNEIVVLEAEGSNTAAQWRAAILNMTAAADTRPVILHKIYDDTSFESLQLKAAADFGMLFIDGLADGIWIESGTECATRERLDVLSLSILQASRTRISKTEYIACPGCGRTLYDLQSTLAAIRSRTDHLVGLKIGVMGCIVNGPGEMADADFGYVGEGAGRITLYRGREVMRRSLPQSEAIDALIELIKESGKWHEPKSHTER